MFRFVSHVFREKRCHQRSCNTILFTYLGTFCDDEYYQKFRKLCKIIRRSGSDPAYPCSLCCSECILSSGCSFCSFFSRTCRKFSFWCFSFSSYKLISFCSSLPCTCSKISCRSVYSLSRRKIYGSDHSRESLLK